MPKSNPTLNMKERSVLDIPSRLTLSKELEGLLDNYETSYQCAGSVIWFRTEPTLKAISEIRSFLDELTDEIIKKEL